MKAVRSTISEIVWADKRHLWFVNGCIEYHRPIITTLVHPKSQNSLGPRLVPIFPGAFVVGNYNSSFCIKVNISKLNLLNLFCLV